jgi:single-strand DNA-binding protein
MREVLMAVAARREPVAVEHANEVHLVGRLSAEPVARELPSGDVVITFRLVVARDPTQRGSGSRSPTVDTIDCAAWTRSAQRSLRSRTAGDLLEVHGALRRRFWRGPTGPASRSEVEAATVRKAVPGES